MTIVERVQALKLPADEAVVIGGGVLDALGLRTAHDIDLVLSERLFAELAGQPDWRHTIERGEPVLRRDDVEAFLSWGNAGQPNFAELWRGGIEVAGVRFAHPQVVIDWKRQRASQQDLRDIALLEEARYE